MTHQRRIVAGIVAAIVVVLADQASKFWVIYVLELERLHSVAVMPMLNFTMVWNHGITFGLNDHEGASAAIPIVAALAVVAGLCVWLYRADRAMVTVALGSVSGGAIGNVIDRLRFGAVVDFIHAHADTPWGDISWYVFNVGDAAIVCGVLVLAYDSQWPTKPAG